MIDHATIQRVKDAADIVDVVREYVTLRRAGVNYKGLCPFHNEKTPSFIVSPAKQLCKCFSCGKGGDVVRFLMEIEQMTYPEAIRALGRKYGIEIKEKELTDEERAAASVRESLFVLNEWARDYFVKSLHESSEGQSVGLAYFRERGLRDDIIRKFQLGYAPRRRDSLSSEARAKGFSLENLVKTGLCAKRDDGSVYDRFATRVIFPVHTVSGKVVAFGGRTLSTDKKVAKYVNSPESEIYSKSHELYGIYLARQAIVRENRCFMVEGYMDVISMHQSGVENVVASSGTSLTEGQIRLLHRFTDNITVLYDGDAAGIHASLRGIDMLLAEGLNIKVMLLPDGDDPDSFARKHNAEAFQEYINSHQTDFITFKTNLLLQDAAGDPLKRAQVTQDIVRSIAAIPDGITRQSYAHECASLMQMDEALILHEISKARKEYYRSNAPKAAPAAGAAQPAAADASAVPAQPSPSPTSQPPAPPTSPLIAQPTAFAEERLLAQQLVRYASHTLFTETADDGTEQSVNVATYIADDLAADGLTMQSPVYARILADAAAHAMDPNFDSLSYFLSHPEADVAAAAMELGTDRYQLSTGQQKQYGDEADHLQDIVPRLLNDFKYAYIRNEKLALERKIQDAAARGDMVLCMDLMQQYKDISAVFAAISQATGDKVVRQP